MATLRRYDDPWARMPWIGPIAALVALAALYGFLRLTLAPPPAPMPRPVTVSIVELPAAAPPAEPQAAPLQPPPPPQAPPPPPPPRPAPVEAPPITPPPTPLARPLPTPEKPPQVRPEPPRAAAPPPQTPSPPRTEAPIPPAVAVAPPSDSPAPAGGSMSARAIYRPMPEIPEELRHRRIDLVAVARFHVGADGRATVELIQPTPDPTLNRALLERLQAWRFFPALSSGKPVASVVEIRIPISVQ